MCLGCDGVGTVVRTRVKDSCVDWRWAGTKGKGGVVSL